MKELIIFPLLILSKKSNESMEDDKLNYPIKFNPDMEFKQNPISYNFLKTSKELIYINFLLSLLQL